MTRLASPVERSGTWVYVYAILSRPVDTAVAGIGNQRVRWIHDGELVAAVSAVPAEDFDEEPLNTNIRDLGWLGPRAVAHQEVNARLHEHAEAIVPLAFGSVFRDDERVRHMLQESAEALKARLDAVRGCSEWVVALHQLGQPDATLSPIVQAARAEIEASSPGRAHLLRQRLATLERDEARRLTSDAAHDVLDELRGVTKDLYVEPLPTDVVERPLVRASVLVPRGSESGFLDTVDRLRQRWPEPTYRLLLTGPWPPYRFGGLERRDA